MSGDWSVPGWAVLATLVGLVLVLAAVVVLARLAASGRRAAQQAALALAALAQDAADLRAEVAGLERRLAHVVRQRPDDLEYVITRLGDEPDAAGSDDGRTPAVPTVAAPLFADLVLREGVVQAASAAAGLRRALAPEMRHRIRFAMRREVKRARKQRRADLREARRAHAMSAP